ncbi:MAG: hypothetical protein NTW16_00785 [Bacteroidetes bacterium]|nr:hypothetical protein [Bacteroidota bacterium]
MKNRIFKSWKTSILGMILLSFALVMVAIGKTTLESLILFLPVSFGLIFTNDPRSWGGLKIVFFIVSAWLMTACSPQARLSRLMDRHPELNTFDTIRRVITLPVPQVKADSFFVDRPGDTVKIDNGRLEIRYLKERDTVKIWGRCKADTVKIYDTLIIPRIKVMPAILQPGAGSALASAINKRPAWALAAVIAFCGMIIFVAAKIFKR